MCEKDYFKESFKHYKCKPVDMHHVIDFESRNQHECDFALKETIDRSISDTCAQCNKLGLITHHEWRIYAFKKLEGVIFIKNPFTSQGQQYWIRRCLELYCKKPSITNLDLHYKNIHDVPSLLRDSDPGKRKLVDRLSWATLGYHHNWDTKIYNPAMYSPFPECLAKLTKHIANCLNFRTFKPEAAIINYYSSKSTLGIHNDHSEEELNQPLISISFGETAVFLVGTQVKTENPIAIALRSGDIVILSGPSRLAFHAVPAIIHEPVLDSYFASDDDEMWKPFHEYIMIHRINLSVRQVYAENVTMPE